MKTRSLVSAWVGACLLVFTTTANAWETSGFRTDNGQLIRAGMTRAEVLRDAGEPSSGKGKKSSKKKKGNVWIYRGSDGYYSITFKGDRVVKIEVAPFR